MALTGVHHVTVKMNQRAGNQVDPPRRGRARESDERLETDVDGLRPAVPIGLDLDGRAEGRIVAADVENRDLAGRQPDGVMMPL